MIFGSSLFSGTLARLAMHGGGRLLADMLVTVSWGCLHILLHEVGHVLAACVVGSRILQVGVSRIGPFVRRTPASTPLRNALVALAGPGMNLVTWFVFLFLAWPRAWIALALCLMNLLPLRNSDLNKARSYLRGGGGPADRAPLLNLKQESGVSDGREEREEEERRREQAARESREDLLERELPEWTPEREDS